MKRWILMAPALLSFACSNEPKDTSDNQPAASEPTGTLSLELVGADRSGQAYRLRHATFDIVPYSYYPVADGGAGPITVSSDTNPDATSISNRVLPGSYYVALHNPGWSLEKVTAEGGGEPVAQSVLLSPATQYTYVYDHGTTDVNYLFGVDGTLIDFRHGDLNIDISIEHPDEDAGGPPGVIVDGG